jgi:hypothetical protein
VRQEPYSPTPEAVLFLLQIITNSEVFRKHGLNTDVINMYVTSLFVIISNIAKQRRESALM